MLVIRSEGELAALVGLALATLLLAGLVGHGLARRRSRAVFDAAKKDWDQKDQARQANLDTLEKSLRETQMEATQAQQEARLRLERSDATAEALRGDLADRQSRLDALHSLLREAESTKSAAQARALELQKAADKQSQLLAEAENRLSGAFKSMAADALSKNSADFLALANDKLAQERLVSNQALASKQEAIAALLGPMRESLGKVDEKIEVLEQQRREAYGRLNAQVEHLSSAHERLERETGNLVRALRAPAVRGRWGEIQLKRVAEIAGMMEYCDFDQQVTLEGDDGRLRPDMVVKLPAGRRVIVDAKVPLEAFLDANTATDDQTRRERLLDHASLVRSHIHKLGAKSYWEQLSGSPEFVVLFLPGEAFYSAALEASPALIEEAVAKRVLVATPTTLIALLQTIHLGWREEKLAENAQKISEQGRVLHKCMVTFSEHWGTLGKTLGRLTEQYNNAVGSLERRVLPAARRLEEMGAGSQKELAEQLTLTTRPRLVAAISGRSAGPASQEPSPLSADGANSGKVETALPGRSAGGSVDGADETNPARTKRGGVG